VFRNIFKKRKAGVLPAPGRSKITNDKSPEEVPPSTKGVRGISSRLWRILRIVGIGLLISLVALCIALIGKPPLLESYSFSTAVTDRNGNLLRLTLDEDENYRVYASLKDMSKNVIEATLLYEDRYFFRHFGVNPASLIDATLDSYFLGNRRRGASTITMQLARMHFNLKTTTPWGKLVQIFYALKLEVHYSKDQILEAYLNLAPYGGNVIGIRAASLIYFAKEPSKLTLAESMALSVIPQNPERRKPGRDGMEPLQLMQARRRLAHQWTKIHPDQKSQGMSLMNPLSMHTSKDIPFSAPHLTTDLLLETPNEKEIRTTLDIKWVRMLKSRIDAYVKRNAGHGITNAAAILVNADTMEVMAMEGSADFEDKTINGQVNALNAARSPGSALKPFVYAEAMDQGLIHPATLLKDAPFSIAEYTPHNFDGEFKGPLAAAEALVRSRNIPALSLSSKLTDGGLLGLLKKAGVEQLRQEEEYGLAPVLGGIEITMADLVRLYAMLKNGGMWKSLVMRLSDKSKRKPDVRLLSKEASFLTLKMLEENPRPGGRFEENWLRDKNYVAWKTGTSPGSRDAWAVGVAGSYVLCVWVGQFQGGKPIYVGLKSAAPLFFDIIDSLRSWIPMKPKMPTADLNVTKVSVCAVSGALPTKYCPHQKESWFIPGKSPIAQCQIHQPVIIDRRTGLRSCDPDSKFNETKVFESWPSDLAAQFDEAGLKRKTPPSYNKKCKVPLDTGSSSLLSIVSPKKNLTYAVRADRMEQEKIAFQAVADSDAKKLYWFVGTEFLGSVPPTETLFWKPSLGDHTVRVVDDKGRTDSRDLKVTVVE
jgi:penicillin-binding protein 1C